VSLIDADLRRPSLHRIFEVESREGLTNMLLMGGNLNGHGVQHTDHPNLDLIVAGPIPPNPPISFPPSACIRCWRTPAVAHA
jgi:Mrp family chromosome partitioning ATPase